MFSGNLRRQIPSPGADWPATVMRGFRIRSVDCNLIVPDTLKTTILGPSASTAARRLPGPLSLRFVTNITSPARPPCEKRPKPSAPGNANCAPRTIGVERATKDKRPIANNRDMLNFFDMKR